MHKSAIESAYPTDLIPGLLTQFGSYYLYYTTGSNRTNLCTTADIESVTERVKETSCKKITGAGGIGTAGGNSSYMMAFASLLYV